MRDADDSTVSGAEIRNHFENDQLWDETGRVWRRKRTAWLTAQDANRWTKRHARVALYGVEGRAVTWFTPEEMRPFGIGSRTTSTCQEPTARSRTPKGTRIPRTCGAPAMIAYSASRSTAESRSSAIAEFCLRRWVAGVWPLR
jgi:hypothetical protein